MRKKSFLYILICLLMIVSGALADDMLIKLPEPKEKGNLSLEESIKKRRSERRFLGRGLSLEQIGQLLWACQGITDTPRGFRASPSAGATYPLEVYIANSDGVFQYIPSVHSLKKLQDKDIRTELSKACFGQDFIRDAPLAIIICADFKRTTSYYGRRGEQYVYIEVGHAAQNVHLEAVSEGLGSVPVGAFEDKRVGNLLNLPEEIMPLYIIPVGYVKR